MLAKSLAVVITAAAVLALTAGEAAAQPKIAGAKSLRCTFPRVSTGTWKRDGVPEATIKPASLVLRFEAIDTETGIAQLRNGSVSTDVTVRLAEGYLHFMQAFRTGPLYTTTVFEAGANGDKFKAVHSRHEYFSVPLPDATSTPEQYYGECEILR
jgi:hypothetical protein